MNRATFKIQNAELAGLAREINDRQKTLDALEQKSFEVIADFLTEALLQGADLNRARLRVKHGDWMPWLAAHCPGVSYWKANRYMRLAANLAPVPNLTGAETLRQALALCVQPSDEDAGGPGQHSLPYIAGINKFSKFNDFLLRNPLPDWPREGVEQLKEDLEPVAKQLWPEKFSEATD